MSFTKLAAGYAVEYLLRRLTRDELVLVVHALLGRLTPEERIQARRGFCRDCMGELAPREVCHCENDD